MPISKSFYIARNLKASSGEIQIAFPLIEKTHSSVNLTTLRSAMALEINFE